MLKEAIGKFGNVEMGNMEEGMKESYVVELDGFEQKQVFVEVSIDEQDLVSINNKNYPINITKEKEELLVELFDDEYTKTVNENKFVYEVKTKGTYFPTVYLEDIVSYYKKVIEKFGSL